MGDNFWIGYIVGSAIGIGGALGGGMAMVNEIPSVSTVQQGYVAPSQLEVELQDADHNGEDETVLLVDDIPYLMMYDSNGTPQLFEYSIQPAEVIPNQR